MSREAEVKLFGGGIGGDRQGARALEGEAGLEVAAVTEGFEDHAHAAAAEFAGQQPWADALAGPGGGVELIDGRGRERGGLFEELLRSRVFLQQAEHFGADGRIGACGFEPGAPAARGEVKRQAEEPLDLVPRARGHGVSLRPEPVGSGR